MERGVPDPSELANVDTTNGTFAPDGAGKTMEQFRAPEAATVQFGDVAVSWITVVAPDTVKPAEFVALETYWERRLVATDWFAAGIATVMFAVVDMAVAAGGIEGFGAPGTAVAAAIPNAGALAPPPPHPLRTVTVKKVAIWNTNDRARIVMNRKNLVVQALLCVKIVQDSHRPSRDRNGPAAQYMICVTQIKM